MKTHYRNRILLATLSSILLFSCDKDKVDPCIDESKINPNKACIEIYAPVCGCDGVTYDNSCYADAAGVTEWNDGACPD